MQGDQMVSRRFPVEFEKSLVAKYPMAFGKCHAMHPHFDFFLNPRLAAGVFHVSTY